MNCLDQLKEVMLQLEKQYNVTIKVEFFSDETGNVHYYLDDYKKLFEEYLAFQFKSIEELFEKFEVFSDYLDN